MTNETVSNLSCADTVWKAADVLHGQVEKFAAAEGKLSGEFYTPRSAVRVLLEMLEPYASRVYDPCFGSGGMFVQSETFVEAHGGYCTIRTQLGRIEHV